jgi:hypothetical protein
VLANDLSLTQDASCGSWIEPRLRGDFGAVTLAVPSGYAAYARICHPASDPQGNPVSWLEVASETGRTVHALMQWHALVGSADALNFSGSLWPGGDPERGDLAPHVLEELCAVLGRHTIDAKRCFFGLWFGWAWVHGDDRGRMVFVSKGSVPAPVEEAPPAFSADERSRPRLQLPGREYLLLAGPLSAASKIGDPGGLGGFEPHSPNLIWPADRAWFTASEIDFDSTLVGGSTDLISDILDAPGLDAWAIGPADSLAYDADHVNEIPARPLTRPEDEPA